MTKEFFEEVMRIPSYSGHEDMMRDFLLDWGRKNGCQARKDGKGNIFLTKGKPPSGQYYPAMCNHIDTVHRDQEDMIKRGVYKEIAWEGDIVKAFNPIAKPKPKYSAFQPRPYVSSGSQRWIFGKKDSEVEDADFTMKDREADSGEDGEKPASGPEKRKEEEKAPAR